MELAKREMTSDQLKDFKAHQRKFRGKKPNVATEPDFLTEK